VPQIYLDINRRKAEQMGVKVDDINRTLQANLGSVYVNDFNKFGRVYQVRVQADARFRGDTDVIKRLEVPGRDLVDANGAVTGRARVPLGTLLDTDVRVGPHAIYRHNLYPAAALRGGAGPGASSGQALLEMEDIAAGTLPATMGFEWSGIAFEERGVGDEAVYVFALSVFLVYLVLAALYESWLLPLAVILVVPLGLLGVVGGVNLRTWVAEKLPGSWLDGLIPWHGAMDNSIYTQIGVVLIIALASKNAILIVEFARELRMQGRTVREAAVEAARMRFRPIIMTSFAFIMGVMPLVVATGAGDGARQALGVAVCGGMITSTVLAVFFVPVFYVAVQTLIETISGPPKQLAAEHGHGHGHHGDDDGGLPVVAAPEPEPTPPPAEPSVNGEPSANGNHEKHDGPGSNGAPAHDGEKEKAAVEAKADEPPPAPPPV
jgi:HAE1 family hydrophobic/amphiphilic exporter-1